MTQHERVYVSPTNSLSLTEWMAYWPEVRGEFELLVERYREQFPNTDPHRLEWVVDGTETALRELRYRLDWVKSQLDRAALPSN